MRKRCTDWRGMIRCGLGCLLLSAMSITVPAKPIHPPVSGPGRGLESNQLLIPGSDLPALRPQQSTDNDAPDQANPVEIAPAADGTPLPEVIYDPSRLPKPVARTRQQLIDAAASGDIERLRIIMEGNELPPTLSLTDIGDPIDFMREASGDGEGHEILAILMDVLEAGSVQADAGTAQEMYLWPYFARYPLDRLTPGQKVELYRIITSWDFAEMQTYGVWSFYRVGIGPDGTWHFFVAGE